MRCAVITPVGPGHEKLVSECRNSVQNAVLSSKGVFDQIQEIVIDDTKGDKGRSVARNEGVSIAQSHGIEWLFFLDADDLMSPYAFGEAAPYLSSVDALWGAIATWENQELNLRMPQVLTINSYDELLSFPALVTVQMGHFVRTAIAARYPFNQDLHAGEDFDYYLRVWRDCNCRKVNKVFFANRRGLHATGPRSATGEEWALATTTLLKQGRRAMGSRLDQRRLNDIYRLKRDEFVAYCRSLGVNCDERIVSYVFNAKNVSG